MVQEQKEKRKVEILAPAGSYDSFRAAILAGADAVYAGGPRFGARAYAENFTEELLLKAIDYAHLHGRKFYLTVNTLLKDSEIQTLDHYLRPLYEGGLDAVIVQDFGVLEYVRSHFSEMEIHASTQMTITGPEGAQFLQEQGAQRVVPARELSLEEIRAMKALTGMDLECFVHGALCYCYSGQCLLSSMIGGRSGNRGQCAQPCRLPYVVNGEKAHWLSPKDICTLDVIPDMVDAGIDSFKIEGRMKRPEYVAGVTATYRKYVDLYLEKGRKGYVVQEEDREHLMDLYNRGGFNQGYYKQHNGKNMMSVKRPNHAGVEAVQVFGQKGREVTGKALTEIHKGDVLELQGKQENYTFGKAYPKNAKVTVLVPKGQRYANGTILYRTKNEELLIELSENYVFGKIKEKIHGFLNLSVGECAKLTVQLGNCYVEVCSEQLVEEASKSPLDVERIRKQMLKTGNTEFEFEQLEIELTGNVFLPMQQLNELRRNALEALEKAVCGQMHRQHVSYNYDLELHHKMKNHAFACGEMREVPQLTALAETKEQLQAMMEVEEIERIYVDSGMDGDLIKSKEAVKLCHQLRESGRQVYLALPHIFREKTERLFLAHYKDFLLNAFDGVLARNLESLQYVKKCGFDRPVILDHNLYVFNGYTKLFWQVYGAEQFTLPLELNQREMKRLGGRGGELVIYGYLPMMVSAQCVTNTVSGCRHQEGNLRMTDRTQNTFTVRNRCRDCYNVIYNSAPLYLLDRKEKIEELDCYSVRLQFSMETKEETKAILKMAVQAFVDGESVEVLPEKMTRGHFNRGII